MEFHFNVKEKTKEMVERLQKGEKQYILAKEYPLATVKYWARKLFRKRKYRQFLNKLK